MDENMVGRPPVTATSYILLELSRGKSGILGRRGDISCEQDMLVVFISDRLFAAGMSGQSLGDSSLFGDNENIKTPHAVGCKSYLLSVGTPYRSGVKSRIRGDLGGTSAG